MKPRGEDSRRAWLFLFPGIPKNTWDGDGAEWRVTSIVTDGWNPLKTRVNLTGIEDRVVTICDREADMYDLFFRAEQLNASLLVRDNYDRVVNKKARYSKKNSENLWALLKNKKCETRIQVQIPKQEDQAARTALICGK